MNRFVIASLLLLILISFTYSQDNPLRYDFSKATAAENGITIQGPGFGALPMAVVSFGSLPTDNAFEGATDGTGMRIEADPGEGVMLMTGPLPSDRSTLLRCSVRSSASHVSVYLSTIDQSENAFVSTLTPNNGAFFTGRYDRIADLFLTPSSRGFLVLVQIVNTSSTEPLTVYLDNLEVLPSSSPDKIEFALSDVVPVASVPIATPTPRPVDPTPTPLGEMETVTVPLDLPAGAKSLEMILIKAGTFIMGSPATEKGRWDDEWESHPITLSQDFYLSKYELTQAQWQAVMGNSPASPYGEGPNYPVYYVSWNDCQAFLQQLNQQSQGNFRLPTEAEWEYACRAGTTTRFYFGDALEPDGEDDFSVMDQYMWWEGNNTSIGDRDGNKEVGLKRPNSWGLFDMHGNVWEWCSDWWQNTITPGAQTDPQGPATGSYKLLRGGSWTAEARHARSAARYYDNPGFGYNYYGFRVARTP